MTSVGGGSGLCQGVPPEMGLLAKYAADADSLTDWSVMLIPGLLQTESYACAFMLADGTPKEDADRHARRAQPGPRCRAGSTNALCAVPISVGIAVQQWMWTMGRTRTISPGRSSAT